MDREISVRGSIFFGILFIARSDWPDQLAIRLGATRRALATRFAVFYFCNNTFHGVSHEVWRTFT